MKWLVRLSGSLVLIAVIVVIALWQLPMNNEESVRVEIQRGDTLSSMARQWEQDGWLPSALLLRIQARLTGQGKNLKAGEFDIPPGLNGSALLRFLANAVPVSYRVTLIEGHDLQEALNTLHQAPKLEQDVVPLTAEQVASLLGISGSPEGWLYPDTYVYHSGDRVSTLLRQAYQRMQEQLQQAWDRRAGNLPYRTPYEALIMASVVEKETGAEAERPVIAGVFIRRLAKNMRLETDPTVIYGLGTEFDGNLRKKHLQDRSNPYNTYRHKGLPPTPIALAGRAALDAALHPDNGDSLYFVARGDGSHYFSSTLEEHNQAVRKYQIFRRRTDYRSAPADSSGNEQEPAQ